MADCQRQSATNAHSRLETPASGQRYFTRGGPGGARLSSLPNRIPALMYKNKGRFIVNAAGSRRTKAERSIHGAMAKKVAPGTPGDWAGSEVPDADSVRDFYASVIKLGD